MKHDDIPEASPKRGVILSRREFSERALQVIFALPFASTTVPVHQLIAAAPECPARPSGQFSDVPWIESSVIRAIYDRSLRSMSAASPRRWRGDSTYVEVLRTWLSRIRLGGNTFEIPVNRDKVWQGSSNAVGVNTYLVQIDDRRLLSRIVTTARDKDPDITAKFGNQLETLDYAAGILVLNRGVSFVRRQKKIASMRLAEWYYLDVYVRHCSVVFPLFRVYFDSLDYWRSRRQHWTDAKIRAATTRPVAFPDYNMVFMLWHPFAYTYGLSQSWEYLRAASAAWSRVNPELVAVYCGSVAPQPSPVIFTKFGSAEIYSRLDSRHGRTQCGPPYEYKHAAPGGVVTQRVVSEIPPHSFPEARVEAQYFKNLLHSRYGAAAVYFGNDLVALRLADMNKSAALVGQRQSPPETTISTRMEDSTSTQAGASGPGWEYALGDWAGDLIRQDRYYSQDREALRAEIPAWGRQCKERTSSYRECRQCMRDGPAGAELENMSGDRNWDMAGDGLAGAVQGCVVGAFAGGWIGCAIGAAAGLLVGLVQSYMENQRLIGEASEQYFSYCE